MKKFMQFSTSLRKTPNLRFNTSMRFSTSMQSSADLRIYNISDLHLESYKNANVLHDKLAKFVPDADLLVLAGDIGHPNDEYKSLLRKFKQQYQHVVLIPGNHEFDETKTTRYLQEICSQENVCLLDNSSIEIAGIKFLGTTLWSRLDANIDLKKSHKVFGTLASYNLKFQENLTWLNQELKETDSRQIIVTHHLPTFALQHKKYVPNKLLDSFFYSEILNELDLSNVHYWFCGHTHSKMQMKHKNTSIIVNPYGLNGNSFPSNTVYTV